MAFNVPMSEATAVLRWTAGAGSARSAALVTVRLCTLRQLRFLVPIALVGLTVLYALTTNQEFDAVTRWKYAALYAVEITAFIVVLSTLFSFLRIWRSLRKRLRPGTELTASWEDESVLFKGPRAEVRYPRATLRRARRLGPWTGFQQTDAKPWSIWPSTLVPDEELARIGG